MPNTPINTFNSGILTQRMSDRNDVDKYSAGCRVLDNMIPMIWGCAERRPGTKFIYKSEVPTIIPGAGATYIFANAVASYMEGLLPIVGDVFFTIIGTLEAPTAYIYFQITELTLGEYGVGPDSFTAVQLNAGDITERFSDVDLPFGYLWGDDLDEGGYGGATNDWEAILTEDPTEA